MPGEKEINALELRKHFGETLDQVHAHKQTYIITKNGRPTAVLLDIGLYQKLTTQPRPAAAAPSSQLEPKEEDRFIEIYTRERCEEFRREDRLKSTP